jgi:amidase
VQNGVWSDAVTQAEAIRRGAVTASDLVREYLDRIDRFDPVLRAYVSIDADRAVAEAREADDAVREGAAPFTGVTISVKDVIDVVGLPTTHSCKALVDNVAGDDSPLVRRLRSAGFIVLGKTNVPEFCTSMTDSELNGTCRNPWDPGRTPAGSSGGAAAALAAGLCAIAHGTDGAGSVRVPAAFCGLVGLKPSRGRVSFGPELGNPYYTTTVDGILSRSVRDAAGLLDVFVGRYDADAVPAFAAIAAYHDTWHDDPGSLRVAVTTAPPFGEVEVECAQATTAVAAMLESLGHDVDERAPRWDAILAAAAGPMSVPGPAGLVGVDQLHQVEPRNRPLIERGAQSTLVEHAQWVEQCRAASLEFLAFWDDVDVLVTPTAGMLPPPVGGRRGTRAPRSISRPSAPSRISRSRSTCRANRPSVSRSRGARTDSRSECSSQADASTR